MQLDNPQYPCDRRIDFKNGVVYLDGVLTFKKGVALKAEEVRDMMTRIAVFEDRYAASRELYLQKSVAVAAVKATPLPTKTIEELLGEE